MHILCLFRAIPNLATGGTSLSHWTMIEYWRQQGCRVSAVLFLEDANIHFSTGREERLTDLKNLGVEVHEITPDVPTAGPDTSFRQRILRPSLEDYYPTVSMAEEVKRVIDAIDADVVVAYETWVIATMIGIGTRPVLGIVVDLDHLPPLYRLRYDRPSLSVQAIKVAIETILAARVRCRFMVEVLRRCDVTVNFAAHHSAWLRRHGLPDTKYVPTPVHDYGRGQWERDRAVQRKPQRVTLIGHLRGTATLAGLNLFAREVLPKLEDRFGKSLEVHLVGGYAQSLPDGLVRALDRPMVRVRGHVEPADAEFLDSDVILVPTPIRLGARVRILVAFSFGCCVVAHRSNAYGIPELQNDENALLVGTGEAMYRALERALADGELRARLGAAARRTFEQHFSPEKAGRLLLNDLQRLANAGERQG